MSSHNNEKLSLTSEQVNEVQQGQQKDQEQDQQPEQPKKKNDDWIKRSNAVTRSAGIDVIKKALTDDITINQSLTQVYNLPIVPEHLQSEYLVSTGSSDVQSTYNNLTNFFETCELLKEPKFAYEGSTIYASYYNNDLCSTARFTCSMYRTHGTEIVFNLDRVDGCGMAFARLFAAFNQSMGSETDRSRQIATFEAPPLLSSLQINSLEKQFTNISLAPLDNCVFEHANAIQSPVSWSLDTLSNILSRVQCDIIRSNNKALNEIAPSFDEILIPKTHGEIIIPYDDCCEDDLILPLPARAQAHMISQSFATLNSALEGQDLSTLSPQQSAALQSFIATLFTEQHTNMTNLEVLLTHSDIDVPIATLHFLQVILPSNMNLIAQLPVELITKLYENAVELTENNHDHSLSPFDVMNHQTLINQVGLLMDKAQQ